MSKHKDIAGAASSIIRSSFEDIALQHLYEVSPPRVIKITFISDKTFSASAAR